MACRRSRTSFCSAPRPAEPLLGGCRAAYAVRVTKVRADQLLVSRGLAKSRTRAQALIMAGAVFSGEKKLSKAGEMLAEDAPLEVRGKDHPWVSRGGIKLE